MSLIENQKALTEKLHDEVYIYIYVSCQKEVLYVGQTRQSLFQRYKQHFNFGNRWPEEVKKIVFFKISSAYSDYCEGYIGYFLQGKYQGCLPNYNKSKYQVPDDEIISNMNRIIRYFNEYNTNIPPGKWLTRVLLSLSLEYVELREETIL